MIENDDAINDMHRNHQISEDKPYAHKHIDKVGIMPHHWRYIAWFIWILLMALTEFTPDLSNSSSDSQLLFVKLALKLAQWLSTPINSAVDLVKVTKKGIALSCYDELLQHGYSRRDLNWVIQPRTLSHRRQRNESLNTEESSRLLRIIRIQILAETVLGDKDKAQRWLIKPRRLFDGMSAKELIQLEQGAPLVEEALIQLDEGYFA